MLSIRDQNLTAQHLLTWKIGLNNGTLGSERVIPSLLLNSLRTSLDHHPHRLRQSLSQSPELGRRRI